MLVFSLANCIGSGPIVKCWDPKCIYFIFSRSGLCLSSSRPYALCVAKQDLLGTQEVEGALRDGKSIEDVLFPQLAKLLMEIEAGFELPHIKAECYDGDGTTAMTLEDVIYDELSKDLGNASYLMAIKTCSRFRATYERKAKRLSRRGQSAHDFNTAKRMVCASIISNMQQSTHAKPSLKRARDPSTDDIEEHGWPAISSDSDQLGMSNEASPRPAFSRDPSPPKTIMPPSTRRVRFKVANEMTLPRRSYSVGWICALPIEMAACTAILDEVHVEPEITRHPADQNSYTFGSIGNHNVVIACLPNGVYGTTSATTVAMDMKSTFQTLRFGMMVGIAGGVPSTKADIRLGDVVVGKPSNTFTGVMQHDMGKLLQGAELHTTGTLNKPPPSLLTAISKLEADHLITNSKVCRYLESMRSKLGEHWRNFQRPPPDTDRLFKSGYTHSHPDDDACCHCDRQNECIRPPRPVAAHNSPQIHYGLIASGNQVIRDSITRDKLAQKGVLCFEMEAAGLMDRFPCLVVRGICDYADSHKNKAWQGYAAATAAAVAKEILSVVH